ncbi:putative wall-associated receptor kinase-like 16 [Neltuma alba]|uniref:putative wall-associated receptor kinase-like 16 n=1 Tax=Neltuma alba TaxID=207710 RepID=UPI0010A48D67|nr:putative wall-associated receptor kinase-like 16 [Prosopis alba]
MMMMKLLFFNILLAAAWAAAEAQSLAGCPDKCRDVDIPYPFGVGVQPGTSRNCFLDQSFNLTCDNTTSTLYFENYPVSNISLQRNQMDISTLLSRGCCNRTGTIHNIYTKGFTISSTQNKFLTIGCDALGVLIFRKNFTYYSGCVALCDKPPPKGMIDQTCSGTGCCQVDIPTGMNNISFYGATVDNHTKVWTFNNCSAAFVAKSDWFSFSLDYLQKFPLDRVPLVVDWTVSNVSCQTASSNEEEYACKSNTDCVDSSDGTGYTCKCKSGFEGNPYHPDGCHGISGALLVVITLIFTLCWARKQRTLKQLKRRNFEQNGGYMLLQQLSQHQGYGDKFKLFTEIELKNATNNFDECRILGRGGQGIVYKGILPDDSIAASKKSKVAGNLRQIKDFINEVFVLSQIKHRNVVKLLGCCLETDVPLLVYEFVDNGTLLDHIDPSHEFCINWETRIRIAAETADAISYLHSSASIPIIHRDIKSTNILLDHDLRAKVSDFGASRLVPLDKTHVTTMIQGTFGYLDPEYLHIGQLNEKSDIYSFGVVLVELLTGMKAVEFSWPEHKNLAMHFVSSMRENRFWEILDKRVSDDPKNAKQLKEVALLAMRCVRVKGEERPTMKEVAKKLEDLIAMDKRHWVMRAEDLMSEEGERLLCHIPVVDRAVGDGTLACYDSILKEIATEIADGR